MAQAKSKVEASSGFTMHLSARMREMFALLIATAALLVFIALITYHPEDPGWSTTGLGSITRNAGGIVGAYIADVFFYLIGYLAYLFPFIVAASGWLLFRNRQEEDVDLYLFTVRWSGFILTVIAGCALAAIYFPEDAVALSQGAGGVLGQYLRNEFVHAFNPAGSTLILVALLLSGFTLFTGISWLWIMELIGGWVLDTGNFLIVNGKRFLDDRAAKQIKQKRTVIVKKEQKKFKARKPPKIEPIINKVLPSERVEIEKQVPLFDASITGGLPQLSLLDEPKPSGKGLSTKALEAMSRQVELKLKEFNIEAEVESVHPGPVVTLFEINLAPGTKASKVTGISRDLARALSIVSVRVAEVIPGKSVIGLEIPNETREMVYLREILQSEAYEQSSSPLTMGLGKDISGGPVVVDLAKMPHALIAGTTGSGKSVAINTMILSLLYKSSPEQVRMIMVDPKMLELSVYEGIPHLLTPVVTDMEEASNALRWCVGEMERRYRLMSAMGVRNLAGFNRKVAEGVSKGEPLKDPLFKPDPLIEEPQEAPDLEHLPFIVIIIDELADMMMVVGKKVEELIARLAQKARAAGIHLLLATQRPSVDVITGLIKANIPTRIAFQVSSRIDSRTILDQMGAEHLLGHGDSLYLPPGGNIPLRTHGAFVDDHEVHAIVNFLKQTGRPKYIEAIVQEPTDSIPGLPDSGGGNTEDTDPLFDEAVRIVTESRRASISSVQRRLKVGYNRAANLVEEMERVGIVSAPEHNGNRTVLAPPPAGL